jgi:hypothetical protein
MESKQKNKKHDPMQAEEIAAEIVDDQLGENTSGYERQNEVYKREHTSKTKKR